MSTRIGSLWILVFLLVIGTTAPPVQAAVPDTGSPGEAPPPSEDRILQASVLVLETATTANTIQAALTNLGIPFDLMNTTDWTGIDFGPYDIVIVGMDGGSMSDASVAAIRTGVIDAGKRACFFGGTGAAEFHTGVNNHIMAIDIVNFNWTISASPQFTLIDPAHPLAQGLPSPVDFGQSDAGFYTARLTDADMEVVAVNGDGHPCLIFKGTNFPGGGSGEFVWFINSPRDDHWGDPGDLVFIHQVVANFVGATVPVELQNFSAE